MRSKRGSFLVAVVLLSILAFPGAISAKAPEPGGARPPARAPAIWDPYGRVAVNNLDLVTTNLGSFGSRLYSGEPGLTYPRGSANTALYAGGIWVSSSVGGVLRQAVAEYGSEFRGGTAPDGAASPDDPRFRNYTIVRGDTTSADYISWPVQDGAPVDALGKPQMLGDQFVWSVFNDADPMFHSGSQPLAIEIRQSTFAYAATPGDPNTIYFTFSIHNPGATEIDSAYVGLWLDPDLGGYDDDLAGCDTTLALGYCYNETDLDEQYAPSPPALGLALLQGPTVETDGGASLDTLGLHAFLEYQSGSDPINPTERHLSLQGKRRDGSPMREFDSPTGPITRYRFPGDPVTRSGWLDALGGDRRLLLSSGPFRLPANGTQEIVAALIVGQGSDRLSSISDLRSRTEAARALYRVRFPDSGAPAPILVAPGGVEGITGKSLTFLVRLLGDDSNAWSLNMEQGPLGAAFQGLGGNTGQFTWTPAFDQTGIFSASFSATRTGLPTQTASTDLVISRPNLAPVIAPIPDFVARFGETTEQPFTVTDPDGDSMTAYDCSAQFWAPRTIEITANPPGLLEGMIRVSLPVGYPGTDPEVDVPSSLCVEDLFGGSATATFVIHARYQPRPPYLGVPPLVKGRSGEYTFVTAFAYDGNRADSLDLRVSGAPPSLHLFQDFKRFEDYVQVSARVEGIPTPDDVGTHSLIWRVSDGFFPDVVDTTILQIAARPTASAPPAPLASVLTTYPIDPSSVVMATGDFNRDGRMDLATASVSSRYSLLGVALGEPEGGFALPISIDLGRARPLAMVSGDWDRDGAADLVVACDSSSSLRWFHSRGDGTFEATLVDAGVPIPTALTAGDFDLDGELDLAVGTSGEPGVAYLRGDGLGDLLPNGFSPTAATPRSMILSDFDRDGIPDLAAACPGANAVYIFLGPLFSSPAATQTIVTVNFPRVLVQGDYTGDGIEDLVAVGRGLFFGASAVVLKGSGAGGFTAGTPRLLDENSVGSCAASGDFDGDGKLDLAVGFNRGSPYGAPFDPYDLRARSTVLAEPGFSLLFGAGDGSFDARTDLDDRGSTFALKAADMDQDGRDELLVGVHPYLGGAGALWVIAGQLRASLERAPGIDAAGAISALVLGDFDADGDADVGAILDDGIVLWRNHGDATFDSPVTVKPMAFLAPRLMEVGDFNGDGFADLVVASDSPRPTLLAAAGRTVGPPTQFEAITLPDSVGGGLLRELRVARAFDLDNDGYDDLVLRAAQQAPSGYGYYHVLLVFRGGAQGLTYERGASTMIPTSLGLSPEPLLVEPGRIEIAHPKDPNFSESPVVLSAWDPLLRTLSPHELPPNRAGFSAVTGDFDGDGVADVAFGGIYAVQWIGGAAVFPRDIDGTLGSETVVHAQRLLGGLIARDFNADGIMDFAGLDRDGASVVMTFGRRGGVESTVASIGYGVRATPTLLAAGDLNGDGAIDLAAACPATKRITFLFNETKAAPAAVLERLDAAPDRVSLAWRTVTAPGSAASVLRFEIATGVSAAFPTTVAGDGRVAFEDRTVLAGTSYLYRLRVPRAGGEVTTPPARVDVPAAPPAPAAPLHLAPPTPNPIRDTATVAWNLPAPGRVSIRIFDVHGRLVDTLTDGFAPAGHHEIRWAGRGSTGDRLSSGVYWIRLNTPGGRRTRKVVLAR